MSDPQDVLTWRAYVVGAVLLVPVTLVFAVWNWKTIAWVGAIGCLVMISAAAQDYLFGISDAAREKRFDE